MFGIISFQIVSPNTIINSDIIIHTLQISYIYSFIIFYDVIDDINKLNYDYNKYMNDAEFNDSSSYLDSFDDIQIDEYSDNQYGGSDIIYDI